MKKNLIYNGILMMTLLMMSINFTSCKDIPGIEEETTDRLFSPVNIDATSKLVSSDGLVTAEINASWYNMKGAVKYSVDLFKKDSLEFLPEHRVSGYPIEVPENKYSLEGLVPGTRYTVSISAIADGVIQNSKYTSVTLRTQSEDVFADYKSEIAESITQTEITLMWPANAAVTHIKLANKTLGGESIVYTITPEEKAAGEKHFTGLTVETKYNASIYNLDSEGDEYVRGSYDFETWMDGIIIKDTTEGINEILNSAADGDVFVFAPGDYSTITNIELTVANKSIELKSLNSAIKANLYLRFIVSGNANLSLKSLVIFGNKIDGDGVNPARGDYYVFDIGAVNEGSITVDDCEFKNYMRSLVRGTAGAGPVNSVSFNNCIVTNVCQASNEFIDLRTTVVKDIKLTNSTFNNCATGRHFLRCDAITDFSGQTVLIDHCSFYNIELGANRLIYQRAEAGSVTMKNCIVEKAVAGGRLQAGDDSNLVVDFNYYCNVKNNGDAVWPEGGTTYSYITGFPIQNSKMGETAYTNAVAGDFTLIPSTPARSAGEGGSPVGDPRWIK